MAAQFQTLLLSSSSSRPFHAALLAHPLGLSLSTSALAPWAIATTDQRTLHQVLPLTLEEWTESDIDSMIEVGGNSYANSIYEAFLPKGHRKPKPDSSPSMSCKIS
ncbi:uncharacterized protein LOC122014510 [Zingiber officinale]|uniref:uncharacterized protein LOC122014510 n=1 Tax=Zingiber officinale TaxID=94328 RepID=UPI001C4D3FA7|nr:uncharacterized protein LOC122014510 [Zingiber officinale]